MWGNTRAIAQLTGRSALSARTARSPGLAAWYVLGSSACHRL